MEVKKVAEIPLEVNRQVTTWAEEKGTGDSERWRRCGSSEECSL